MIGGTLVPAKPDARGWGWQVKASINPATPRPFDNKAKELLFQDKEIMNTAEGFFGVGAIIGPAILARLLTAGLSWTWLYVIAGTMCVALILLALLVRSIRKASAACRSPSTVPAPA